MEQVTNRVNAKNNSKIIMGKINKKKTNKTKTKIDNGIIVKMENGYGRIVNTKEINNNTGLLETKHTWAKFGFQRPTRNKIKPHIARMHIEAEKHKDIDFPYYPGNFKDLQPLNRHVHINKYAKR